MRVLTAIASHEVQHVGSLRSCYLMQRQSDDALVDEWRRRGDVARESMVHVFLGDNSFGDDDGILLLDADQLHPADLLERLRAHDLDMVCAHYYARQTSPVQSLCYEIGDGRWPYLPMLHPPTSGLHEIAVTGFGCVLIKKKVLKAVQAILPEGMSPIGIGTLPEVAGDHANWGPDFRFFHHARLLGYKLWLDASIESLHGITVWLGHKSAERLVEHQDWADAAHEGMFIPRLEMYGMNLEAFKQRGKILQSRLEELEQRALEAVKNGSDQAGELSIAVYQMQGKIMENLAWIEWAEKYPAIERPDQLPTTANTPKQETLQDGFESEAEARDFRYDSYRKNAEDLCDMMPKVRRGADK